MKALITGITGFVGGFLAEHLLESGDQVLGTSRAGGWSAKTPIEVQEKAKVLAWDIGAPRGLSDYVKQQIAEFTPDVVFHLAAVSTPSSCGDEVPNFDAVSINVEGTSRVVQFVSQLTPQPRLLFTSTSHVYAPMLEPEDHISEEHPLGPNRGYGMTKRAAEELVLQAGDAGLEVVVLRAFQHTGPRQMTGMMLPDWSAQFAQGGTEPVEVVNTESYIDITDVRDVVKAYRLLAVKAKPGMIYNVGSGTSRRTGDILEILQKLAGTRREIKVKGTEPRYDPIADIARLQELTGWQPQISIEQTVADTLRYWQERPSS